MPRNFPLTTAFKIILEVLANPIKKEKAGKEEIKLYLFAGDVIIYIKKTKRIDN